MTGIVLIGGRSTRFGRDKVVAPVGDKLLIEHVIEVIEPLFEDILLIGHKRDDLRGFNIIEDLRPGCGPLGGIYTALSTVKTRQIFVFAADMPNLNEQFISHMISISDDHDIVIPVWSQGREPLHAIYHKRILPVVKALLDEDLFKIFNLLNRVDTSTITEEVIREFGLPEKMFANINTLHDIKHMVRQ
ncbi:MAG TPA: molybdenum cofactor guanylyltransferase [Deltaproteobacteria bacterium]|nr:molybdenum cofactor guanylyltransferase [Deltaproteobacteria bacterium]